MQVPDKICIHNLEVASYCLLLYNDCQKFEPTSQQIYSAYILGAASMMLRLPLLLQDTNTIFNFQNWSLKSCSYPKSNSNIIQIAHTTNYDHTSSPTLNHYHLLHLNHIYLGLGGLRLAWPSPSASYNSHHRAQNTRKLENFTTHHGQWLVKGLYNQLGRKGRGCTTRSKRNVANLHETSEENRSPGSIIYNF